MPTPRGSRRKAPKAAGRATKASPANGTGGHGNGGARPPVDKIMSAKVSTLIPYAKNPRLHSPEQVGQIAASMREFGQTQLVVVDERGEIIAGHGRVLAAEQLGWSHVTVGVAVGWTGEQKRAYRIADNQLALSSVWDMELLGGELGELRSDGFDLGLLGFDDSELFELMADAPADGADPEAVPEPPKVPIVKRGDLWILGNHRLLCGDATNADDVARLLAGAKPHLMVTDPPYGVGHDPIWREEAGVSTYGPQAKGLVSNDDRIEWREAWSLFQGDVVYVWHAGRHARQVQESLESVGLVMRCQIIWAKPQIIFGRGDYHWQHEPCWYAVRKGRRGRWSGDRKQSTLWSIQTMHVMGGARGNADNPVTGHSTQKPVECMKRPIENNSKAGDAVYDPFVGSGTTIIAAEMMARRCFAIDIDPVYVEVSMRRWEKFTGKKAVLDKRKARPKPGVPQSVVEVQAAK